MVEMVMVPPRTVGMVTGVMVTGVMVTGVRAAIVVVAVLSGAMVRGLVVRGRTGMLTAEWLLVVARVAAWADLGAAAEPLAAAPLAVPV